MNSWHVTSGAYLWQRTILVALATSKSLVAHAPLKGGATWHKSIADILLQARQSPISKPVRCMSRCPASSTRYPRPTRSSQLELSPKTSLRSSKLASLLVRHIVKQGPRRPRLAQPTLLLSCKGWLPFSQRRQVPYRWQRQAQRLLTRASLLAQACRWTPTSLPKSVLLDQSAAETNLRTSDKRAYSTLVCSLS